MSLWSAVPGIEASYPPPTWEAAAYLGSHMPLPGDRSCRFSLEEEGKKWRGEFERLAREKSALTNERDDLQRRLKDTEEDKARAQQSHDKELAHAAKLSDQNKKKLTQ